MSYRILITGSRDWTDETAVQRAILNVWLDQDHPSDMTIVHGACHLGGADIIAAECARTQGFTEEPHPADWSAGKKGGPERNQRMVDLGADICLAFPLPGSRGTYDCIRRAKEAGIPVRVITGTSDG